MTTRENDAWLAQTLSDRKLSRNERQELSALVASLGPQLDRESIRRRAFELASAALTQPDDRRVLTWLEDVVKALREGGKAASPSLAEAYFSPGDECVRAIDRLLARARNSADVCVFTITDDRLAEALLDAHRRGVSVRIITDNAKAEDLGSDVDRFRQAGIPLLIDRSPFHMHHKFAVIDGETLLTGSYNWTLGAARDNVENLIVVNDPRLVSAFSRAFAALWKKLDQPPDPRGTNVFRNNPG